MTLTVTVRDYRPADAKAVADLRRAVLPYRLATPRGIAWEVSAAPAAQRLRLSVAQRDGRIVGAVQAGVLHDAEVPGQAAVSLQVHPGHRGRGVGHALLTSAEDHLFAAGADRIFVWATDEPGTAAFAQRHGYRRARPAHYLRLDLTAGGLPSLPSALPSGVRLHTGADFEADPRLLYAADTEISADEPGEVTLDAMAYEDWLLHVWEHPHLDPDLTSVVTVDGEIASFALAATDGDTRYSSAMTGTRRAFRGRGLAGLAKAFSLHRARDAGCTEAFTHNDAGNTAMLAVNRAFGYRPFAAAWRYVRERAAD
ncbi:N-acetylglutamate synthase, GNAT family [Streptomyces sp. 2224.1]|uniref:GNAT family N-acetyltransferase n=1 Tax=unclassified Streptomyces TaxID=2593676 RepID=UPI00088B1BC4|nr:MULTISPECIES: GNAT family N-acetyltransferase [unclassified Streptomyces]PBC81569.1 N-acetylglutamate synthase-like GNAT family acetyltransferase [Streptomyces sp. 2321.6]SDR54241.1 N-acetylglutamate synthase, GNAT family [Streptomyces sp. KS_16]SEC20875.1 N-acetylglutamate synthase, GNAT family [Streptomyces sp. 2133.1]SED11743.1 N-acetylglutamate synthase, GNAT family [Streptomyces sp. 2224.1]SEF06822.1 N-acetylglutamate synthase, GNAT family [Streptomyces sp. 2112.3]